MKSLNEDDQNLYYYKNKFLRFFRILLLCLVDYDLLQKQNSYFYLPPRNI